MPDPTAVPADAEIRAVAERALAANYELDNELGRGGMGIVYRAKDRRLKRLVAIKLLPPELAFRSEIKTRFLREAETAAQLSHPNIVPIYSVDERDGLVYFVMALVEGPTLAKKMYEDGQISADETRRVMREVADALAYAHARGVIHRDIKPDNILLDKESGRALVTDFGIARAIQEGSDSRLTATGVAIGTPAFMSPEQAAGDREIDGRTDLYALGVVAYQMLSGRLPFQASTTASMLMKQITERPTPVGQLRSDCPADLAATVMSLLEKEPENRVPSAAALSRALSGDVTVIPAVTDSPPPHRTSSQNWEPRHFDTAPSSPLPASRTGISHYSPATSEEIARWMAPEVRKFRGSFGTFAFVNAVIVIGSIFGHADFYVVTVFWSMVMAFKYSKLWNAGYDWRDVFRQPRDRRLVDLAGETIEEARGLFDKERRAMPRPPRKSLPPMPLSGPVSQQRPGAIDTNRGDMGPYRGTVQRAEQDRGEILRMVSSLPPNDQSLVDGVIPATEALFQRIQLLAQAAAADEKSTAPDALAQIESQISELEALANPLERGSEDRVRRLALLKRQRRGVADVTRRHDEARAKLDSCVLALQNMRLDIVRLRAGAVASAGNHITQLTERARSLADEVDAAIYGAESARGSSGVRGAP
ncbi:MAG TPA: serine/threonine-protein kinase [Gemmatimonadaceae bacterium]|nr:serine/threonine-protein kinase [Gemmatimonadaceae bacterium]